MSVHVNELCRQACEKDAAFFEEAFRGTDCPADLKRAATRICRSYGINGICDPVYIANVIAVEIGRGDGQSNFNNETI